MLRPFPFFFRFAPLGALACGALLAGCGKGRAHEAGLEWKNAPMEIIARVDDPSDDLLRSDPGASAVSIQGSVRPRRLLTARTGDAGEGEPDSLLLLDFGSETDSYLAFQELTQNPEDFAQGFSVSGDRVYFRRGRWVGSTAAARWKGIDALENSLSVPGTASGTEYALPPEFNSLVRQRRVEGSERILTREFMGLALPTSQTRIYAVRLECQTDTAWVFAAADLAPGFADQVAKAYGGVLDSARDERGVRAWSPTATPIRLRFSGGGMAGVEGCFDDSLTDFWIKMQSRALKNLK